MQALENGNTGLYIGAGITLLAGIALAYTMLRNREDEVEEEEDDFTEVSVAFTPSPASEKDIEPWVDPTTLATGRAPSAACVEIRQRMADGKKHWSRRKPHTGNIQKAFDLYC